MAADALSRVEPSTNCLDPHASLYLISFRCPLWLDLLRTVIVLMKLIRSCSQSLPIPHSLQLVIL